MAFGSHCTCTTVSFMREYYVRGEDHTSPKITLLADVTKTPKNATTPKAKGIPKNCVHSASFGLRAYRLMSALFVANVAMLPACTKKFERNTCECLATI